MVTVRIRRLGVFGIFGVFGIVADEPALFGLFALFGTDRKIILPAPDFLTDAE
jgi:hypothetical protein